MHLGKLLRMAGDKIRPKYTQLSLDFDPKQTLKANTLSLERATGADRNARERMKDFINKHGMKKILATGALAGGGATATVLAGQSLLTPEEEVVILEETPAPEGSGSNNQALLAAALLAAGGGGMLATDEVDTQLEELTQKLQAEGYGLDDYPSAEPGTRRTKRR